MHMFTDAIPEMLPLYLVIVSTNAITLGDVTNLLDKVGGLEERFTFF